METYEVQLEPRRASWKQRAIALLVATGVVFVIRFGLSVFLRSAHEKGTDIAGVAIEAGFFSLFLGTVMYFQVRKSTSFPLNYKLLIDEDSITCVAEHIGVFKKLPMTRRTVRRGKIRSIFTVKAMAGHGGIGISERSVFGARMLGFVFVPKTLPEYDDVKRLAESWRVVD